MQPMQQRSRDDGSYSVSLFCTEIGQDTSTPQPGGATLEQVRAAMAQARTWRFDMNVHMPSLSSREDVHVALKGVFFNEAKE